MRLRQNDWHRCVVGMAVGEKKIDRYLEYVNFQEFVLYVRPQCATLKKSNSIVQLISWHKCTSKEDI